MSETKDKKEKAVKEKAPAKETPKAAEKTAKAKPVHAEDKAEKTVKKKAEKKSRKVKVKKDAEVLSMRKKVNSKTSLPTFRGRFGKRESRKKSKEKWDKWRYPRGIDVKHEMSDGYTPNGGRRTPRTIRDVHPSGFREFEVRKVSDIAMVPKNHAIRIIAGLGKKKKLVIVDKAIEKGIKVLNP